MGGLSSDVRHFGSSPILALTYGFAGGTSCMDAQTPVEEPESSWDPLLVITLVVFLAGFLLGIRVTLWVLRLCRQSVEPDSPAKCLTPAGWKSVVIRALRFIRRRRHVALAFNNYKTKPLRQLPVKDWPRRSLDPGEPVTPLREGPAFSHGSLRHRAQRDQ